MYFRCGCPRALPPLLFLKFSKWSSKARSGVVLLAQLCAIAETAAGELALVSPDCLNDLAPASELPDLAIQPPTPQEQQAEDWLKVKVLPMLNQERQQPTGIADPAGLPETGNGISDSKLRVNR